MIKHFLYISVKKKLYFKNILYINSFDEKNNLFIIFERKFSLDFYNQEKITLLLKEQCYLLNLHNLLKLLNLHLVLKKPSWNTIQTTKQNN